MEVGTVVEIEFDIVVSPAKQTLKILDGAYSKNKIITGLNHGILKTTLNDCECYVKDQDGNNIAMIISQEVQNNCVNFH